MRRRRWFKKSGLFTHVGLLRQIDDLIHNGSAFLRGESDESELFAKCQAFGGEMSDGGWRGAAFDNFLAGVILVAQAIEQGWIGNQSRDEHRQNVPIPVEPGFDQGTRSGCGCLCGFGVEARNYAVD